MHELKAGVYKHYKGGLYLLIGVGTHSETDEAVVVYVALSVSAGRRLKVRPYSLFVDTVAVRNRQVPRFLYIGDAIAEPVAAWYDPKSGYRGADRDDS